MSDQPSIQTRITAAYREAGAIHFHTEGIEAHLKNRMGFFRAQLGQLQSYIDSGSSSRDYEVCLIGRDRLLDTMEAFFALWRATPVEGGAALLYSQTVAPPPAPPSQEELFNGSLSVLRKQRGIILKTVGEQLSAYPASKLTPDERDFLIANKAKVHARILAEEDTWLL